MTATSGTLAPNPVQLEIEHQPEYSRLYALLGCFFLYGRIIALIPILIVLYVFGIVAFIAAWAVQFVVLFTGKYPDGPYEFVSGYLRWSIRAQAWLFGLTDRYPTTMRP